MLIFLPRALYLIMFSVEVVGAIIIFSISLDIPKWFCIYSSDDDITIEESGTSVLSFVLKAFLHIYFVNLLFFCGASAVKISISFILGILSGAIIVYGIQVIRSKLDSIERMRKIVVGTVFVLHVISAICFASGCRYIEIVWEKESKKDDLILYIVSFCVWLLLEGIISISIWKSHMTTREVEANADLVPRESNNDNIDGAIDAQIKRNINHNNIEDSPKEISECPSPRLEKIWTVMKQTFLICTNLLFLYLVIVNIGATYQFRIVQRHLKGAQDILYPSDYNR